MNVGRRLRPDSMSEQRARLTVKSAQKSRHGQTRQTRQTQQTQQTRQRSRPLVLTPQRRGGEGLGGMGAWGKGFPSKHYSVPRRRVGLIPTKREEQRQRYNLIRRSAASQFRTLSGVALSVCACDCVYVALRCVEFDGLRVLPPLFLHLPDLAIRTLCASDVPILQSSPSQSSSLVGFSHHLGQILDP